MNDLQKLTEPDVASDLLQALAELQPSEQRNHATLFAEAYPAIEHAIARGVTQKAILTELTRFGLKLHPSRFKGMLDSERQLRDANGNRVCCETCGAMLPAAGTNQAKAPAKDDGGEA